MVWLRRDLNPQSPGVESCVLANRPRGHIEEMQKLLLKLYLALIEKRLSKTLTFKLKSLKAFISEVNPPSLTKSCTLSFQDFYFLKGFNGTLQSIVLVDSQRYFTSIREIL